MHIFMKNKPHNCCNLFTQPWHFLKLSAKISSFEKFLTLLRPFLKLSQIEPDKKSAYNIYIHQLMYVYELIKIT